MQDNGADALLDQGGVAHELEHVAHPLLCLKQDGAAGARRAVPQRLRKRREPPLPEPLAPLVLSPAALEVTAQQPGDRAILADVRKLRFEIDGAPEAVHRLVQAALVEDEALPRLTNPSQ